jgi:hypothetical protein
MSSTALLAAFFFFDGLCAFDLLNSILFSLYKPFTLDLILCFILFLDTLVDFIVFLAEFGLVLEAFCVPEGVEAVVCGGAAGGDAGYHDDSADLCLGDEGVPEDECEFGGPEGHVVGLVIHGADALLQCQQTASSIPYLLLISAPSILRCRLLLCVSCARSLPARSTSTSFPLASSPPFLTITWQMAWERELVSLAAVAWVVRLELACSMIPSSSFAFSAFCSVSPGIWMLPFLSSRMLRTFFSLRRSRQRPP